MILLTPADYKVMPWKNGLGSTVEIYRVDGSDGEMDWRVSIASVIADGPFSNFAGYDRHIMAIEGAGMILRGGPDGPIAAPPLRPQRFSGDWAIEAKLIDGPVKDLNLMARRSEWNSRMELISLDRPKTIGLTGETFLMHVLGGGFGVGRATVHLGCSLLATLDSPLHLSPQNGACTVALCKLARHAPQ